jgi:polysaccharide pyruvyl transferase WcaK-like protein
MKQNPSIDPSYSTCRSLRSQYPATTNPAAGNRVPKTIGLLDHLGHGNLGDDATLGVVMQNIRSRWPHASLIGLSLNPYDTEQRHGIPSYAIRRDSKRRLTADLPVSPTVSLKTWLKHLLNRCQPILRVLRAINTVTIRIPKALLQEFRFLAESHRIVRSLDMLIMCGGGQLLDWGGPWRFPYTLFKWTLLAKLSGVACYYINVGAGPLRDSLSKSFIKFALLLSDYASFRDEDSRKLVQDIGFQRSADVFPDNVYSLEVPFLNASESRPGGRSVVGISPMAYRDPRVSFWDKDQAAYDRYISQLALFASSLARDGHRLRLFSTEIFFDSLAIEDLQRVLKNNQSIADPYSIRHEQIRDTTKLFAQMSSMDYIVTSRFHGVVFAHLMTKPVLAISPHPKVATLMNDTGLSAYCVDIRSFDLDLLKRSFSRLVEHQAQIKRHMAKIAASYKARLLNQFDYLFPATPIMTNASECRQWSTNRDAVEHPTTR